jgi:putative lipoprotein
VTWQWEQFQDTAGVNDIQVTTPEQFTLTLMPDGTAAIQADCNRVSWTYTLEGSSLTFNTLGPSTLAFCGEESLDQQYLMLLGETATYVTNEGKLVLNLRLDSGNMIFGSGGAPESGTGEDLEIVGVTWQWEQFQDMAETNDIQVPNPESYTLTLMPDGTAAIQADCNQVSWTYTLEDNSLTFNTLGPSTLAFCGEESLDQQYLLLLGETATYVTNEGNLVLNLKLDSGNMIFGSGGSAGVGIDPSQISLNTQGLASSWQAVMVPTKPYDESQPPGPMGLPEHIEILFGVTEPADRQFGDPIMYIIPVNAYRAMWNANGNPSVSTSIDLIEQFTLPMPTPPPSSGIPALPGEETPGFNDLAVQWQRIFPGGELNETSATQNGYRFVGRWNQDANPVTNQGLRYVYQGFTNDGQYLVSFWWPVSTSALPDDPSGVSAEDQEIFSNEFNQETFDAYMEAQAEALNSLSTSDWEPDLATLDALVASLQIEGMPVGGIQDKTWFWIQGPVQPGSSEIVVIENPELYQATYGSDGVINFTADCNSGSLPYQLNIGGMFGNMLAEFGPMTLAECGPSSLSQSFASSLQAAQDYRIAAGGNIMRLELPAGGGTLIMSDRKADFVNGQVTYLQRIALPDDAEIEVQIQDVSLADAKAQIIGTQLIKTNGRQVPIPYQVFYNPDIIVENHSYSMSARITAGGQLLFINDTNIPVITQGNPTKDVEVVVVPVG